jgi:hypothetical protein
MTDRAGTLLRGRRERLERLLDRKLGPPLIGPTGPLSSPNRAYLLDEAKDLYWNELEWEHITDEEALEEGPLTELIFPGFLAFVRGLLLREVMPDSKAPASPRPQVVEDLMAFLAERAVQLEEGLSDPDADAVQRLRTERDATSHLLDLVLYVFHQLSPEDIERVEAERHASA